MSIEGMMSPFSMQVMDALLAHQEALGVTGHLLEFGVYKGRSAYLVSAHVREQERFILVDIRQLLTEEVLGKLHARPEFVLGRSEDFRENFEVSAIRNSVRFLHVDSSHAYRTTLAEMALIEDLLAPDGIACLDDFTNLDYSQILPAAFKYLYTTETDLAFFMVTRDKGYLCRRPMFDCYGSFVLRKILGEMRIRGNPEVVLSRTDADPEVQGIFPPRALSGRAGPTLWRAPLRRVLQGAVDAVPTGKVARPGSAAHSAGERQSRSSKNRKQPRPLDRGHAMPVQRRRGGAARQR